VWQASGLKGSFSYEYVRRLEYDKFEQRVFTEAGNNVRTLYTYRPDNRLLANLQAGKGAGNPFQNLNYTYDKVGNVLSLANDVPIAPESPQGGPTTQTFRYDDLYRLVEAAGSYQVSPKKTNRYQFSMTYDSIDNILSKQQKHEIVYPSGIVLGQQKTTYDWTYAYGGLQPHAATHIGDRTFTYDLNGNQLGWIRDLNWTGRTIAWDEENRIQSITDNGREMAYKYDAAGQRVIKHDPQRETVAVNQFYTVRNGQIGTKQVFAGATRLVSKLVEPNAREMDQYYYHPDHLGSSNYVTDVNGQIYEHMEYFPSGETWVQESSNTPRTPYLYTGKELDEETGLYYFGARYFDPRTSFWQSPDPAIERYLNDVSSGDVYNPANLSLYAYGHQNPLKYVDPDGRKVEFSKNARGEEDDPEFSRMFWQTVSFLRSRGASAAIDAVISSREVVKVERTSEAFLDQSPDSASEFFSGDELGGVFQRIIYWTPNRGLKWTETDPAGHMVERRISPATALEHEAGHALHSIKDKAGYARDRSATTRWWGSSLADKWSNREEAHNIKGYEWPAAIALGEGVRPCYSPPGIGIYRAQDPRSTLEAPDPP
jgi:RHS repeat-associated protein